MNERLRRFLEANGLRSDATENEAWALYDQLRADGIEFEGDIGTRSDGGDTDGAADGAADSSRSDGAAGRTAADPVDPPEAVQLDPAVQGQIDRAVATALEGDQTRRNELEARLQAANLMEEDNGNFARGLLNDPRMTLEQASRAIFKKLAARTPAIGAGATGSHILVTAAEGDKFRAAVTDGLLMRTGIKVAKPAAGYREFRGRTLLDICREGLQRQGIATGMMSRRQLAARALNPASSSDLPYIFGAVVNKHLLQAYNEWPATFMPFVAITDASDFKDIHSIRMSEAPDLETRNEHGEYKTATFSDQQETYHVVEKGKIVRLTRVMVINDDMRALTRIPQLFGSAGKRMESDMVYGLITANGTMNDSVALFHATHNNLASAGAAPSSDTLSDGRKAMRTQTGLGGASMDIQPAFLLIPVDLETSADILLRSAALPDDNKSAGVINPWAGKLTPIAEPRLSDNSTTAWYLMAHPNQAPVIEVAWLEGERNPYVDEELDFDSDGLKIKVRHDFGCGVVDYLGAYKNPGA